VSTSPWFHSEDHPAPALGEPPDVAGVHVSGDPVQRVVAIQLSALDVEETLVVPVVVADPEPRPNGRVVHGDQRSGGLDPDERPIDSIASSPGMPNSRSPRTA
jgi:hypothetical protein